MRMTDDLRLKTIVWYTRVATSTVAYLVPKDDDNLVIGATSEEMGYENHLTGGGIYDLLRAALEAVPGVYDLPLREATAGLRPGSRDDAPILGPTSVDGLILATGHYRKGVLLAPITAEAITDYVLNGEIPDYIRPFGLDRFKA